MGRWVVFRSVLVFEKFPWTVSGLRKWGLGLILGDFSIRILAISWLDSEEPGSVLDLYGVAGSVGVAAWIGGISAGCAVAWWDVCVC